MKATHVIRIFAMAMALAVAGVAQNAVDVAAPAPREAGQASAPAKPAGSPFGVNMVPNPGFTEVDADGKPVGWVFKHWGGTKDYAVNALVQEGKSGGPCLKFGAKTATDIGYMVGPIKVKPGTTYRFGGSIKTEGVTPADGTSMGAVITVLPMRKHSAAMTGTQDWRVVRDTFTTTNETEVYLVACLGGMGMATGTVWYEGFILREKSGGGNNQMETGPPPAPPPPPYRRPLLDDPLFNVEGLSLDKDQLPELAELLASVVCNFATHPVISDNSFRAQALGLALRLEPRNRTAVVANSTLDSGRELRPTSQAAEFNRDWEKLDAVVRWMHGAMATPDDQILAAYLGDLTRRMKPDEGFGKEYAKLHEGNRAVDWSKVLPPLVPEKPPVEVVPPTPEVTLVPTPKIPETPLPPLRPQVPAEKILVPGKLASVSASMPTVIQTGGQVSRAAMRKVTLQWDEWEYRTVFLNDGKTGREKIYPKNDGPVKLRFRNELQSLQEGWHTRAQPMLRQRYEGWPQRGVIEVSVPNYGYNNGNSGLLAVALCFESMARGLSLDPKVAAVGGIADNGNLVAHSHLPGIVFGYVKDWSEVLLVGVGAGESLKPLAESGLMSPFLQTQIIEVANLEEAVAMATGKAPPELRKAMEEFKAIQAVRSKMDLSQMAQNRFVVDKIREVAGLSRRHISAAMLLKAVENQNKLPMKASMAMLGRMYAAIEQLTGEDMDWVTTEEGMQTLNWFNERLRELKPRMDRRVDSLNIRFDNVLRAVADVLRLRDRSTGTAQKRVEDVLEQVNALRDTLDTMSATEH